MMSNIEMKRNLPATVVRVAIFLSTILVLLYFLLIHKSDSPSSTGMAEIGGPFQLTDYNGSKFDIDSLKGTYKLIYFGFASCPDICPASAGKVYYVLNSLKKKNIPITGIFISVDPLRDTPENLKLYLANMNGIIGLTGTEEEVKKVADLYKIFYTKTEPDKTGSYMINHTSFIYLMGKNGEYIHHFHFDDTKEHIIEYIQNVLRNK